MGIKTTPFRRIALYVIEHAKCKTEIGLDTELSYDMAITEMHFYPDNKVELIAVGPYGVRTKYRCILED